jgi:hypothetical protein
LFLPKLIAGKLASALNEIPYGGRPKAGQESRGTLFRDDDPPTGEEALVYECGVYLNACLDDIDGCEIPSISMNRTRLIGIMCLRVIAPCVILYEGKKVRIDCGSCQ